LAANPVLDRYRAVAGDCAVDALEEAAREIKGARVIHVCSSGRGGGVAELLKRQVPLMQALGLRAEWWVLAADDAFMRITKDIHRGLQGDDVSLRTQAWTRYREDVLGWAAGRTFDADVVIVHDPQPLPLVLLRSSAPSRWLWRCHIDLTPADEVWTPLLQEYVGRFDATIVSTAMSAAAVPHRTFISAPSIDPLAPKNIALHPEVVASVLERYGLGDKPYVLQVSRFDAFKDPVGVVRAFRSVRREMDCALVLASGSAEDDPEQLEVLEAVRAEASQVSDVHLLLLPPDLDHDINALQRGATVVVQKSIREGFGLPVTEAMWKGKCTVGGRTSGIALQIADGVNGYLVSSESEAAERIVQALRDPELRQTIGAAATESVRGRFLVTRELTDYCRIMREAIGGS
jgi:trehalose synthase